MANDHNLPRTKPSSTKKLSALLKLDIDSVLISSSECTDPAWTFSKFCAVPTKRPSVHRYDRSYSRSSIQTSFFPKSSVMANILRHTFWTIALTGLPLRPTSIDGQDTIDLQPSTRLNAVLRELPLRRPVNILNTHWIDLTINLQNGLIYRWQQIDCTPPSSLWSSSSTGTLEVSW